HALANPSYVTWPRICASAAISSSSSNLSPSAAVEAEGPAAPIALLGASGVFHHTVEGHEPRHHEPAHLSPSRRPSSLYRPTEVGSHRMAGPPALTVRRAVLARPDGRHSPRPGLNAATRRPSRGGPS